MKDLLLWMESRVISCNQGEVPGYNTLESCIADTSTQLETVQKFVRLSVGKTFFGG